MPHSGAAQSIRTPNHLPLQQVSFSGTVDGQIWELWEQHILGHAKRRLAPMPCRLPTTKAAKNNKGKFHPNKQPLGSEKGTYLGRLSQPDNASYDSKHFSWFDSVEESRPEPLHLLALVSDICGHEAVEPAAAVSVCAFQGLLWGLLQLLVWVQFPLMFATGTKIKQSNKISY